MRTHQLSIMTTTINHVTGCFDLKNMSTPSTTSIEDLSLECVALVQDNLKTVHDLSIQRHVSPSFRAVADKLLLTFHSVKYFPNAGRLFDYLDILLEHNLLDEANYRLDTQTGADIFVDTLNDEQALEQPFPQWLPSVMSNVTNLVVVLKNGDNYDLNEFLTPWASQLESLTLVGNSAGYEPLDLEVISTMTSLRRLNLFNFDLARLDVSRLAPVLSNLSHLGFYGYIEPVGSVPVGKSPLPDRITPFLACLTPGVCLSLSLSHLTWNLSYLEAFTKTQPKLLAGLKQLHLNCQENGTLEFTGMSSRALTLIVKACPELTSLQTSGGSTAVETFNHILKTLSPLAHLSNLRLLFLQPLTVLTALDQPLLPGLRHLQLNLSPLIASEEDETPIHSLSNLKNFLTRNCPNLEILTLFTDCIIGLASDYSPVHLQHYKIMEIETAFLTERYQEAILAYQKGGIEEELVQLNQKPCVPTVAPSPNAVPVSIFFRSLFQTRLDEYAGSLAQRKFRRNAIASILNSTKFTNPLVPDLQTEFHNLLTWDGDSFEVQRERTLSIHLSPKRLRQLLLSFGAVFERSTDMIGWGSSGLAELARRNAIAPLLAPLLTYAAFHSPLCPEATEESTPTSQKHIWACFHGHYEINWNALSNCRSENWEHLQMDMSHCFYKFEGNGTALATSNEVNNVHLADEQIPSLNQLAIQSWRSYLATGEATNWLHSLMKAIPEQLAALPKKSNRIAKKRRVIRTKSIVSSLKCLNRNNL